MLRGYGGDYDRTVIVIVDDSGTVYAFDSQPAADEEYIDLIAFGQDPVMRTIDVDAWNTLREALRKEDPDAQIIETLHAR